jgi:hypothetical protein
MAKSTRPTIRVHDVELNEVIDREMNDVEFDQYQANQAADAAKLAEVQAKATAKAAILERIGLTADELQTILG